MTDKTAEEIGNIIIAAQAAIHKCDYGWCMAGALQEFGELIKNWALHPANRNWDLFYKLEGFIERLNKHNGIKL